MTYSDKAWEDQMKQILDKQEIVFEEADWEAAHALIQATNLPAPPPNRKKRGLGWFLSLLVVGSLFGYLIGTGHFAPQKMNARNEAIIAKKEKEIPIASQITVKDNIPKKENNTSPSKLIPSQPSINNQSVSRAEHNKVYTNERVVSSNVNTKQDKLTSISNENKVIVNEVKESIPLSSSLAKAEAPIMQRKAKEVKDYDKKNETNTLVDIKGIQTDKLPIPPSLSLFEPNEFSVSLGCKKIGYDYNVYKVPTLSAFISKKKVWTPLSLNIYTGSAYSLNPTINSNFYGGLNVGYHIASHVKLNAFANYSERRVNFAGVTSNSIQPLTVPNTVADFTNITTSNIGISASSAVVTTEQIYLLSARYLSGGIGIAMPFKRHEVFANVSYLHLLNTKSKYTVNIVDSQSLIYEDTKNVNNFVAGINKTDIALGLGYQYSLTRRLQVQVAANMGLKDMSKDSYYQNHIKQRNFQVQTGISYRLF